MHPCLYSCFQDSAITPGPTSTSNSACMTCSCSWRLAVAQVRGLQDAGVLPVRRKAARRQHLLALLQGRRLRPRPRSGPAAGGPGAGSCCTCEPRRAWRSCCGCQPCVASRPGRCTSTAAGRACRQAARPSCCAGKRLFLPLHPPPVQWASSLHDSKFSACRDSAL